jgi:hypothetical protein
MRVIGRTDRLAGRVVGGSHLVEQEKGIDPDDAARWERATDDEAAALGLSMGDEDTCDRANLGHDGLLESAFDASASCGVPATHFFLEGNGALRSARRIASLAV